MSTGSAGGAGAGPRAAAGEASPGRGADEEQLRAAYEAELKRIRVESLVLEQVVTLVNMGMRRTGLAPGTEDERDPEQVRLAIDTIRALMPIVEPLAGSQAGALRDALSQLQLAYVRIGGRPGEPPGGSGGPGGHGGPGGPGGGGPGGPGGGGPGGPGGGGPGGPGAPDGAEAPPEPKPGEPGPAQRSGRLWVPGQ